MTNEAIQSAEESPPIEDMSILRRLFLILLNGFLGAVVAGVSSSFILEAKGPTFAWEMAGMVMFIVTTFVGALVGCLSAAICAIRPLITQPATRTVVGLAIGFAIGLVVGSLILANSSATSPRAPEGLVFWGIAVVVVGGSLAGALGGLLAEPRNLKDFRWHFSLRTLLVFVTLVAVLLALIVLLGARSYPNDTETSVSSRTCPELVIETLRFPT
jgi:MFS family permease